MKKLIFLSLCISLLYISSCKKEDDKPKEHDFHYLITKDVHWNFHFQGHVVSAPGPIQFDTSYHRYAVAGPTGKTETIDGNIYYYFFIKADNYKAGNYLDSDSGIVLLREDLEDKMIYIRMLYPGVMIGSDYDAVDFTDYSGETYFDYVRPSLNEYEDGTILIGGIETKKSSVNIPGKGNRFYKAVGIGSPYGPFGWNANLEGYGGYIVSMDFHFKGETLHFDY